MGDGFLIGINGFKQSGKDTVYQRMVALGYDPTRFAFADKLKVSAMAGLGFRRDSLGTARSDDELIEMSNVLKDRGLVTVSLDGLVHHTITGRQFLQFSGTEGGREVFGDSFWVDLAMEQAVASAREGNLVVITDVRFPNEAKAVIEAGGEVWEVVGPVTENEDYHESESALPNGLASRQIDNSVRGDDFSHLDDQIKSLMQSVGFDRV